MERSFWLDWLRLLALFMVVMTHCCDPVLFNPDPNFVLPEGGSFWGAIWQAGLRPCVPIFACLTGALLLPIRHESMGSFYKKRIGRVLPPFLIWSVVYCLFPVVVMGLGGTAKTVTSFFVGATAPSAALGDAVRDIAWIPIRFTIYNLHMWYVYLIIGLYLYLPIFSAWVERASLREKLGFLGIWGITLWLPYLSLVSPEYWGVCAWNPFSMVYYFAGFSGYLLLGHVVATLPVWGWGKTLAVAVPTWLAGYLSTLVFYRVVLTGATGTLWQRIATAMTPAQASMPYEPIQELPLLFCSINVALMVVGLLILFRKFNSASPLCQKLLANLTVCGFGLYLIHYFFVGPSNWLVTTLGVPMEIQIPVAACIAFPAAWGTTALLKRIVPGKWFLG